MGIAGVSGGGKTTLARRLLSALPTTTAYLSQDQYILPSEHPGHPPAPHPLQGLNKDTIRSVDVAKMEADVRRFLSAEEEPALEPADAPFLADRGSFVGSALRAHNPFCGRRQEASVLPPVLILEGFLLFSHGFFAPACDLRFFLTLTKERCRQRRSRRTFTASAMSGGEYFEACVWPAYESALAEVVAGVDDVHFLDGATPADDLFREVSEKVVEILQLPKEAKEGFPHGHMAV